MLEKSFLWIYQLDGDVKNLQFINDCFTTISGHFFWQLHKNLSQNWSSNSHFEVLNLSKSSLVQKLWYKTQIFPYLFFCKLHETSYMKLTQPDESMKGYFQAILWISLDQIIVQAPFIPHFKGLVMRNLEYEIRICQKIHTKVTISMLSRFFWIRLYIF